MTRFSVFRMKPETASSANAKFNLRLAFNFSFSSNGKNLYGAFSSENAPFSFSTIRPFPITIDSCEFYTSVRREHSAAASGISLIYVAD
jgi:hypothetical protein